MCGRVYIAPANPELRALVKEMNRSGLSGRFASCSDGTLQAEGELTPSAVLPVMALNRKGERRVFPMQWGYRIRNRLLINARLETAMEKPVFRESWESHRCVIPVSWYYEWEHDAANHPGQKFALHPPEETVIRLAGLYRMQDGIPAFVVLTCAAAENLRWMHDRMPVMLTEKDAEAWISPAGAPRDIADRRIRNVVWEKAM